MKRLFQEAVHAATTKLARMTFQDLVHGASADEFIATYRESAGNRVSTWALLAMRARIEGEQQKATIQRSRVRQAALLQALRKSATGTRKKLSETVRRYCSSLAVKITALDRANKSISANERLTADELIEAAKVLNLFDAELEFVRVFARPKKNGFRIIRSYGVYHRARQLIVDDIVKAVAPPTAHQYAVSNKGRNLLVGQIIAQVEQGAKWFVELDVEDCFPSFGGRRFETLAEEIKSLVPFSKEVVEHSITAKTNHHQYVGTPVPSLSRVLDSRNELPQGSKSSNAFVEARVAAAISEIVPEFAPSTFVGSYLDNVVLMASSKRQLEEAVLALERSVDRCSSGLWRLKPQCRTRRVDHGFQVLGYHIHRRQGVTNTSVTDDGQRRLRRRIGAILRETGARNATTVDKVAKLLNSWISANSRADNIRKSANKIAMDAAWDLAPERSAIVRSFLANVLVAAC